MSAKTIFLFMWGYQQHYRNEFEILINKVLKELGIYEAGAECLLVGYRIPGYSVPNEVCVEPEDGKWPLDLFQDLQVSIKEEVAKHPEQGAYYTHEPTMRDQPEKIRRDSIRKAVQKALTPYDEEHKVYSFAGFPAPVDGYYVVPILQLPLQLFESYRPLPAPVKFNIFTGHPSLIHAAVSQTLKEALDELHRPDPGRFNNRSRSPEEIVRQAAAIFMRTPGLAIEDEKFGYSNLFERFNLISSLMYEGAEGTGKILLAQPYGGAVDILLQFAKPVPFRDPRWSRKILQMASSEIALIADCEKIFGLGNVVNGLNPQDLQNVFEIEFLEHYHWQLSCGDEVLLVSKYGLPSLPQERFPRARLLDTYRRLFGEVTDEDVEAFIKLFETAISQRHGSMIVIAQDAELEADRLKGQGTRVKPTKLTPEIFKRVSGIDGTIIIDSHCVCHAIGVILDGPALPECTPSRGSRYNSGIRYIGAVDIPRIAVVVSDDRTVDVIPVLRPRIKRSDIEMRITDLEGSTHDNYHKAINWLDQHRFYLNQEECDRVNNTLKRIEQEPRNVGEIILQWGEFSPDAKLDDDYFETEDKDVDKV